jgi:RNA polymerase sigma-70 factor (ECF subfamily)
MLAPMADVPLAALDDEALAERARAGDDAAFGALVERYQERVYRLALRLSSNPSDAEEVLQESFLQAWRKIDTFRGDARFGTWLYRIATNTALMRKRAARRRPAESLEAFLPHFEESGLLADLDYQRSARADEVLERAELTQRAREALDLLDENYRAVFVLRDLEEMSTEEAARVLEITPEAVRQRLHRARLMVRGYLAKMVGES